MSDNKTVEPLTDEQIDSLSRQHVAATGGWESWETVINMRKFARALLAATHTASKETEKSSGYICSDCGAKLRAGWACDACGSDMADEEVVPYWAPCNPACDPEFNGYRGKSCDCESAKAAMKSTSKADTVDRNAVLEEAIAVCKSFEICHHPDHIADAICELKSATPSTIKDKDEQ